MATTDSTRVELLVPGELLELIDAARGETPRNRWILETVAAKLGKKTAGKMLRGRGRPKKRSEGE